MPRFKYIIQNLEPVRIADNSSSQMGQTSSLRYIPGAAVRGAAVSALLQIQGAERFEEVRQTLLSSAVRFSNAIPCIPHAALYAEPQDAAAGSFADGSSVGHAGISANANTSSDTSEDSAAGAGRDPEDYIELIPTPLGFYESKSGDRFVNVLRTGEVDDGMKRAGIGEFCILDGTGVTGFHVVPGSDMKNNLNTGEGDDQKIFRSEYIERGHLFAGYVFTQEEEMAGLIEKVFAGIPERELRIGSGRNQASGRCRILAMGRTQDYPGSEYGKKGEITSPAYMELLSDTVMRGENGEYCGLNLRALEECFGVTGLTVERCASSVRTVQGYNSTWRVRTPSAVMYRKGSVFRLTFQGTIRRQKAEEAMQKGIGIRRSEGFGQILFLEDYENISEKKNGGEALYKRYRLLGRESLDAQEEDLARVKGEIPIVRPKDLPAEELHCLQLIASSAYMQKLERAVPACIQAQEKAGALTGGISSSVLGNLEAIMTAWRYDYRAAKNNLYEYFRHAGEKEKKQRIHKEAREIGKVEKTCRKILELDVYGLERFLTGTESVKETFMDLSKEELLSEAQLGTLRLDLLIGMIRYHNKQNGKKEA
ncbi:MAG: hypothetical protein Q4D81_04610 [Eubacteriales bacterium]|nr:hypothetical protein [Eubacteriales bacterium]